MERLDEKRNQVMNHIQMKGFFLVIIDAFDLISRACILKIQLIHSYYINQDFRISKNMLPELRRIRSLSSFEKRTGISLQKLKKNMENAENKYRKERAKSQPNLISIIHIPYAEKSKKTDSYLKVNREETSTPKKKVIEIRNKKSLSTKIIQIKKLRYDLRKNDPQKKLTINGGTKLSKIKLEENEYKHLKLDEKILGFQKDINIIIQNQKIMLENKNETELLEVPKFQKLLEKCQKLSGIHFFKYFIIQKMFHLWKQSTKRKTHEKSKGQSTKKIKINIYVGLSEIRTIGLKYSRYKLFVSPNMATKIQDFEQYLMSQCSDDFNKICLEVQSAILERGFEIFYRKEIFNRNLTREEKRFLLLQKAKPEIANSNEQFEYLRQIWTNFRFCKMLREFEVFMKLAIYETSYILTEFYEKILSEIKDYLSDELTFSHRITYKQYFESLLRQKQPKSDFNLKLCQRCQAGILFQPIVLPNTQAIKVNFNQEKFFYMFSNFLRAVPQNIKIISFLHLEYKEEQLFIKKILEGIDKYSPEQFIQENQNLNLIRTEIQNLVRDNFSLAKQRFGVVQQYIQQLFADIMIKSNHFQEGEMLIRSFNLTLDEKYCPEEEEKKAKQIQKYKNIILESFTFFMQKKELIKKIPNKIKAGIFLISLVKTKDIFQIMVNRLQNKCLQILLTFFKSIQKALMQNLNHYNDNISLFYCEIKEFVQSTKIQLQYQDLYICYLTYTEIMNSIINFFNVRETQVDYKHCQIQFKVIKFEMQKLKEKIEMFDVRKINKLKQLKKSKSKIREQIKRDMIIFQNEIHEVIHSPEKTPFEKFSYFPNFQSRLRTLREVIDNFMFVENMQIDYCVETKVTHFSAFSKLQNDVILLKDILEKFIDVVNLIEETYEEDMFDCDAQKIYNMVDFALSEAKVSQLALVPYTTFIQGLKQEYSSHMKFFRILFQLQMFSQEQLNQIGNGTFFDFKRAQIYSVKQVKNLGLEESYNEIKGMSIKKFYEKKLNEITIAFEKFIKEMKFNRSIFLEMSSRKSFTLSQNMIARKKKSCIEPSLVNSVSRKERNEIKSFLEEQNLQLIQIFEVFSRFQERQNSQKSPESCLEKLLRIQASIQEILEILENLQKKGEEINQINDYYNILNTSEILTMPELKREIELLKNVWNSEIVEYFSDKQIGLILREKEKIKEKLENFTLCIENINTEFDNKFEVALRQTPVLYYFSKKMILNFLSAPLQFYIYNYNFIQDIFIEKQEKQLVIQTIYQQSIKIKLYHREKYTINEIDTKISAKIQKQLQNLFSNKNNLENGQNSLLQIAFVGELINLHEKIQSTPQKNALKYIEEEIEQISSKNFMTVENMLRSQILISACIEIREMIKAREQSELMSQFFYSSSSKQGDKQSYQFMRKTNRLFEDNNSSKKRGTYKTSRSPLTLEKKKKLNTFTDNIVERVSHRTKISENVLPEKQIQAKKKQKKRDAQILRAKSETQITHKNSSNQKRSKRSFIHSDTFKIRKNKEETESFKVYYNNLYQKIELGYHLIDFRLLNFYPCSEKMMLSYFNAFYSPTEIRITQNVQIVQEFSSRLFKRFYLINKESLRDDEFLVALKSILRVQNTTVIIKQFENLYKVYGKKIIEIQYEISKLQINKHQLYDDQRFFSLKQIKTENQNKTPNIFIFSENSGKINQNNFDLKSIQEKSSHFRTISYESPPIQMKLQVFKYTLSQRFRPALILQLIEYMKTYNLFLSVSKYSKMPFSQMQAIFLWLLQTISFYTEKVTNYAELSKIYNALLIPFQTLGQCGQEQNLVVTKCFESIKSIFSVTEIQETITPQSFQLQIQSAEQMKKVALLVGQQCSGKTYYLKKLEKEPNTLTLTINVDIQNILSNALASQVFFEEYLLKHINMRRRFSESKLKIIFQGFLREKNSILHEYLITNELNPIRAEQLSSLVFQQKNLNQITPKSIPYVKIIILDKFYHIYSDLLVNLINNFIQIWDNQAKSLEKKTQIKTAFGTLKKNADLILEKMSKNQWNYNIRHQVIFNNIKKFMDSLIRHLNNNSAIKLKIKGFDKILKFLKFLINYSIYWVIYYSLNESGRKKLNEIKEGLEQFSNLAGLNNYEDFQKKLQMYIPLGKDQQIIQEKSLQLKYSSQFYIMGPEASLLNTNLFFYMSSFDQVIVYGNPNSGKSNFINNFISLIESDKKIYFFAQTSSMKDKIISLNTKLIAATNSVTMKDDIYSSSHSLAIKREVSKTFLLMIQDNYLDSCSQNKESSIIFSYIKYISQRGFLDMRDSYSMIPNISFILERRKNFEKNNLNWESLPIYFCDGEYFNGGIFEKVFKKVENLYESLEMKGMTNGSISDEQVVKFGNNSRLHEILNIFRETKSKISNGKFNWLNLLNEKVVEKSLKTLMKLIETNKINNCKSMRQFSEKQMKRRPSISASLANTMKQSKKSLKPNERLLQEFFSILLFYQISFLEEPLDEKYRIKEASEKVASYFKEKKQQMQEIFFYQSANTTAMKSMKQQVFNDEFMKNLRKLEFAVDTSNAILINKSKVFEDKQAIFFFFEMIDLPLIKIEGQKNEAINQIKRNKNLDGISYYYIPLHTLQANPELMPYIQQVIREKCQFISVKKEIFQSSLCLAPSQRIKSSQDFIEKSSKNIVNESIRQKIQSEVFIIEYPAENQNSGLIKQFMECKFLTDTASILWLSSIDVSPLNKEKNTFHQQNTSHFKSLIQLNTQNENLYEEIRKQFQKKTNQNLKVQFKNIEKLYESIRQAGSEFLPSQLQQYLFRPANFSYVTKFYFKNYFEAQEKIIGHIKTTETVLNSLENIFEDYQKIKQQLNLQWQKQRDIKLQIIDFQKIIEQETKKLNHYEASGLMEQLSSLKLKYEKNHQVEIEVYNKLERYKSLSAKYQDQINRQELAQLKYFFNAKFQNLKNFFEATYFCITEDETIPDKQLLRKHIMDINLISRIKEKQLLEVTNPKIIELIESRLQENKEIEAESINFNKNMLNWIKYSIRYCSLNKKKADIYQSLNKQNQALSERILKIKTDFNVQQIKNNIAQIEIKKQQAIQLLKKTEKSRSLINSKLVKLEQTVETYIEFKEHCLEQLQKCKKAQLDLQGCLFYIAFDFYFIISIPEIYRDKFKKITKKQLMKIMKIQVISVDRCYDIFLNYIFRHEQERTLYHNQMLLTSGKKATLLAIWYKLQQEAVILYDPYKSFISDIDISDYIEIEYENLFSPQILATLVKKSLIIINLPQNQEQIEYIQNPMNQNSLNCNLSEFRKIRVNRTQIKLALNQECLFVKKRLSKLTEKTNKYSIICYDFDSLKEDKKYAEKAIRYIFCNQQAQLAYKFKKEESITTIQKPEREIRNNFYQINEEICKQIMSFTINQPNHLQKISCKIKEFINQKKHLKRIKQRFQFKDYQSLQVQEEQLSSVTGAAFHVFKKLLQNKLGGQSKIEQFDHFFKNNCISHQTHQSVLYSAIQLAIVFSLRHRKWSQKFSKGYISFLISFFISGIQEIDQFFIELKLTLDEQIMCQSNTELRIKQIQLINDIFLLIKSQQFQQREKYQILRVRELFKNSGLSQNLKCQKALGVITKKIEKDNISGSEINQMIDNNLQLSEIQRISLKQLFTREQHSGCSQRAILSQINQEKLNKYSFTSSGNALEILITKFFDILSVKCIKTEKGFTHHQYEIERKALNLVCQCTSEYWKNLIYYTLKKGCKYLQLNSGGKMKYEVLKLSEASHWRRIFQEIREKQSAFAEYEQKIEDIILDEYLFVIIQDSFTEKNIKNLKKFLQYANTILLTSQSTIKKYQPANVQSYSITLSQFLNIFMKPQNRLQIKSIYIDNINLVKFWEQNIRQITIRKGNLAVNLFLAKFYKVVHEYISFLDKMKLSMHQKVQAFKNGLKTVLHNHFLFEIFDNNEQLQNYYKKTDYAYQAKSSQEKELKRLWRIIRQRNQRCVSDSELTFQSKKVSEIQSLFKQNFYKIKNFAEEMEKIEIMSESPILINYVSQGKSYIKNYSKQKLLEKVKIKLRNLMEQLSPLGSKFHFNQENYLKHLESLQILNKKNLTELRDIIQEFLRENSNQNSLFLNNVSSPFSIYLLKLMLPEAIKFALVEQESQNSNKIDIIYRTKAQKLMKSVRELPQQSVLCNKNGAYLGKSEFETFPFKLTEFNYYFSVEFSYGAISYIL